MSQWNVREERERVRGKNLKIVSLIPSLDIMAVGEAYADGKGYWGWGFGSVIRD